MLLDNSTTTARKNPFKDTVGKDFYMPSLFVVLEVARSCCAYCRYLGFYPEVSETLNRPCKTAARPKSIPAADEHASLGPLG